MNSLALACLLALAVPVEPVKPEPKPPAQLEVQDLLLLHEEGPLRIRLRISNGEKSVFARWHEHLDRWFFFADRNRNGMVDADELDRMPSVLQMQYMLQNGQFVPQAQLGAAVVALKDVDLDGDGTIDRHEYFSYYLTTTAGPLLIQAGFSQMAAQGVNSSAISDNLFRALDANRDGKLDRGEMGRAAELLARYDTNDDEIVTAQEFNSAAGAQAFNPGFQQPGRIPGFALNLVAVPREASELRVTARLKFAKEMVARFDTDRNGTLSTKEFKVSASEFAACDNNRDGQLDGLELVKWLVNPPHLSIQVKLDTLIEGDSAIEVKGDGVRMGKVATDGLDFRIADATLQVDRNLTNANRGFNAGANMKQYFMRTFEAADTQKTGKLSVEEINRNPQTVYLRQHVKWLDMDNDGVVTLAEIDDFILLTSGGANSQLAIGFLDQGRGLFEILDTEYDNSLTLNELQRAPKALESYLKSDQQTLSRTDIPRRYQVMVTPNSGAGVQMRMPGAVPQVVVRPGVGGNPQATPRKGPMWFQKMDVNLDNHVSPREFLGTMTTFKKMDTDGDGLVSHKEAEDFGTEKMTVEGRRPEVLLEAPREK